MEKRAKENGDKAKENCGWIFGKIRVCVFV